MWDTRFDERDVKEIRTKTTTFLGVGAIAKIDDIAADLKARGIDSILCVTGGHSYKLTGAWDYVTAACAKHGIRVSLYDKVTPNPTTDSIDEAAALGRSADAKAVLCIGGGSPMRAKARLLSLLIQARRRKSCILSRSRRQRLSPLLSST